MPQVIKKKVNITPLLVKTFTTLQNGESIAVLKKEKKEESNDRMCVQSAFIAMSRSICLWSNKSTFKGKFVKHFLGQN